MLSSRAYNGGRDIVTLPTHEYDSECALDIPGSVCSTKETILSMKTHLIKKNINVNAIQSDTDVLRIIKADLNCSTEECVLKSPEFATDEKKELIDESLIRIKPDGPANSTKLLNNENIDEVLEKLTYMHKKFYHMHFQMIDFAGEKDSSGNWITKKNIRITPTELGTIDMANDIISKGYTSFAVVMNTDVRTNGGIHWFSLYCDFSKSPFTVEYFNSSGYKPVAQIQDWLIKTKDNIDNNNYKATIVILSGVSHQQSETECGLYSLYYIWNRLNGIPAEKFQEKKIPDKMMYDFRKKCFSHRSK